MNLGVYFRFIHSFINYSVASNFRGRFFSNFVCFSESPNFNISDEIIFCRMENVGKFQMKDDKTNYWPSVAILFCRRDDDHHR